MDRSQRTLPDVIYTAGLSDLGERVIGQAHSVDYPALKPHYLPQLAALGESLIVSPRVVVKAGGRSLILPILVDYFQPVALLELLESGALEFLVWTHDIGSIESVVLGMPNPHEVERDPGSLAERDLTVCFPTLDNTLKKELIDAFVRRSTPTDIEGAEEALNVAVEFAERGVFGERAPGRDAFINSSNPKITAAARTAASDLYATAVVLKNEYDIFETDGTWQALKRVAADIARSASVVDAVESVYAEGDVPSIRALLTDGRLSPQELLSIRKHPATSNFQRWLWRANPDQTDGAALSSEFLRALDKGLDPKDGRLYKSARIMVFGALGDRISALAAVAGGFIGHAVAGAPGAVVGSTAAGYIAGQAVSLTEPYIPGYFRKPDPRQYIDHVVRPLSKRGRP